MVGTGKLRPMVLYKKMVKKSRFTIGLVNEWEKLNTYYYTWLEEEVNKHWEKQAKKVFQGSLF